MDVLNIKLGISVLLALTPIIIWGMFFFKDYRSKKKVALVFSGGIIAVAMMALFNFIGWAAHSPNAPVFPQSEQIYWFIRQINPFRLINLFFTDHKNILISIFIIAGMTEEVVKQWLIRHIDEKKVLVQNINDSIRFSFIAALGFAFAENIYYFYQIWNIYGAEKLFAPFVFRSTFTTAAHMIFSGIFGYYYGMGKFCIEISEQEKWANKKRYLTQLIASVLKIPRTQAFREQMILKGLFISMIFHGIFNFLLELGYILPVTLSIIISFGFLMYLLKRKAGSLTLVTDIDSRQLSTMGTKEEKTVIEYMGMLYSQGKYQNVIETCERLLEKDPDNNVVKLFQAKALDKQKLKSKISQLAQKKQEVSTPQTITPPVPQSPQEEKPLAQTPVQSPQQEEPEDNDTFTLKL